MEVHVLYMKTVDKLFLSKGEQNSHYPQITLQIVHL